MVTIDITAFIMCFGVWCHPVPNNKKNVITRKVKKKKDRRNEEAALQAGHMQPLKQPNSSVLKGLV